jgi:UDP-N-acetylmuramate: L-alanyl-gamma-D-glutamyl-meso-diaminopimelate ligase
MSDDNGNVLSDIAPGSIRRIHLVGVAGTGMGSFAGMLKTAGYEVTGSDESVYPPMSDMLAEWGVQAMTPYSPANIDAAKPHSWRTSSFTPAPTRASSWAASP